jgi:hypothetical protein
MKHNLLIFLSSSALFILESCSSTPLATPLTLNTDFPSEIIDAHVHTRFDNHPEETSKILYSESAFLEALKKANVIGAVSMNARDGKGFYTAPSGSTLKIINCFGVKLPPSYSQIERGLKENKYACIKIYLGYIHAYASDKVYQPIYKMAVKYNVPVVFHTGDTYSKTGKLKYSDPLTLDEVAVDHPKMKIVIAHVGNPWIQSAAEVAYKNSNVYVDGSALLIGDLKEYSREDLDTYLVTPLKWAFHYMENPKKLMFGTDWPLTDIRDYAEEFKKAIPKEHWEKVFKTNAQEVFGL